MLSGEIAHKNNYYYYYFISINMQLQDIAPIISNVTSVKNSAPITYDVI